MAAGGWRMVFLEAGGTFLPKWKNRNMIFLVSRIRVTNIGFWSTIKITKAFWSKGGWFRFKHHFVE